STDVEEFSDLRPICLLPITAKMLELMVCDMIRDFMAEWRILPKDQSGFRARYITGTALCKVNHCSINLYADDAQLLIGFSPENAENAMQRAIDDL
ncbi:hypothetical protein HHI36_018924, partial [Cryptolaemus montrouzieri]